VWAGGERRGVGEVGGGGGGGGERVLVYSSRLFFSDFICFFII